MKREKKTKKTSLIVLSVVMIGISCLVVKAATGSFNGFAWIGNNNQNGQNLGDPAIGMVGMNSVTISEGGDQKPLIGSAWMGIGSFDDKFNDFSNQDDYPSIGWIHFNQTFGQAKLDRLFDKNCFGEGDCHGVRWNKKVSGKGMEGYLSGWATVELGPNGDTTPYPDVWVHFKSPGNPAGYSCNENDHNYYVCTDSEGRLEGYAWSAGADETTIDGNPGLGWINFSKQLIGLSYEFEPGGINTSPASSRFCATLLGSNQKKVGCIDNIELTKEFELKAYPKEPAYTYQWDCDRGMPVGRTDQDTIVCRYTGAGSHTPILKVNGQYCANQTTVILTDKASCSVSVNAPGIGTTVESSNNGSISVALGQPVEARVNRQCLDSGKIMWTIGGKNFEGDEIVNLNTSESASIRATAKIIKDSKTYDCGSVDIRVTESIEWH